MRISDWSSDVCSSDLLDRTQGDLLDHALATGTLDVLAFAERVLHQIEEPRDDVLHQGLSAEADGEADDTGSRQQGADINPEGRERPADGARDDGNEEEGPNEQSGRA